MRDFENYICMVFFLDSFSLFPLHSWLLQSLFFLMGTIVYSQISKVVLWNICLDGRVCCIAIELIVLALDSAKNCQ